VNIHLPGCKLILFPHVIHDFFQRLLFLNVQAITYLLLILPIIHHLDQQLLISRRDGRTCGDRRRCVVAVLSELGERKCEKAQKVFCGGAMLT